MGYTFSDIFYQNAKFSSFSNIQRRRSDSTHIVRWFNENKYKYWKNLLVINTTPSAFAHDTDFFNSSSIVITENEIIFFAFNAIFSFNLDNGRNNWRERISSTITPIVDGDNIFFVSDDGFFVTLNRNSGEIIRSNNILKILKTRKQKTKITGFVMGSGKIYATTRNGFLIICSPSTGKVEGLKKIGGEINSSPIISDGSLFILTEKSKIFGLSSKI